MCKLDMFLVFTPFLSKPWWSWHMVIHAFKFGCYENNMKSIVSEKWKDKSYTDDWHVSHQNERENMGMINPLAHKGLDKKDSRVWARLRWWLVEVTVSRYSRCQSWTWKFSNRERNYSKRPFCWSSTRDSEDFAGTPNQIIYQLTLSIRIGIT